MVVAISGLMLSVMYKVCSAVVSLDFTTGLDSCSGSRLCLSCSRETGSDSSGEPSPNLRVGNGKVY
jgi:hypothetical protein